GHVSIVMLSPTTPGFMYTTELVLLGERCNIDIKENIQDRALGESIYRAWDLGQGSAGEDLLAKAKNEAKNIQSRFNNNRPLYSKNWSNTWTNTWNCASYAERIVRATGLNVSAGFFITSPLELTTGHSIVSRMVINKTKSGNQAWYVKG
ncbi:MAG: hypothetical protein OEZ01_14235, partial [Candidatus Heimdallarchaeota archaeon]|nr:hypothetical protein [Candidatus Heimdallarchaeota archaeon]